MKTFKQKITPVIVSSLMVMALVVTPFVSSANNGSNKENKNNKNKISVRADGKAEIKSDSKSKSDDDSRRGLFTRAFGWFGNRADAANTKVSLTPSISGITAPTVLKVGETGTWTVKASDPKNGSLEYSVNWGENSNDNSARKMAEQAFVQTSTFTNAYATAGKYHVKFTVSNTTGQKTNSSVTVHVTDSNVSAPVISNVVATSTKPRQATITWTTDVKSSSKLWYGTASPVVTSGNAKVSRSGKLINHKVNLSKLKPNTTYYLVVGSGNKYGVTKSSEVSFTTPSLDTDAPVITSLSGKSEIILGDTATVTVNAYDPKNSPLAYSADWGDAMFVKALSVGQPISTQSATFEHVYTTPGTYTAKFTAENSTGQKTSSSMKITVKDKSDQTPPVISNISTTVSASVSTITWTTDEPTTSRIFYSINSPVNVNSETTARVSDTTLSTSHSMAIPGLTASTGYRFVIDSRDSSDNSSLSSEGGFTTTSS